jgi:hypothetical protein
MPIASLECSRVIYVFYYHVQHTSIFVFPTLLTLIVCYLVRFIFIQPILPLPLASVLFPHSTSLFPILPLVSIILPVVFLILPLDSLTMAYIFSSL